MKRFFIIGLLGSCLAVNLFGLNLTVDNQLKNRTIGVRFCDEKNHCKNLSIASNTQKKDSVKGGYLANFQIIPQGIGGPVYGAVDTKPTMVFSGIHKSSDKTGSSFYLVVNKIDVEYLPGWVDDRGTQNWIIHYKLYSGDKVEEKNLIQQGETKARAEFY